MPLTKSLAGGRKMEAKPHSISPYPTSSPAGGCAGLSDGQGAAIPTAAPGTAGATLAGTPDASSLRILLDNDYDANVIGALDQWLDQP